MIELSLLILCSYFPGDRDIPEHNAKWKSGGVGVGGGGGLFGSGRHGNRVLNSQTDCRRSKTEM